MKLIIINGTNLNLLGKREPEIYGSETFDAIFKKLQSEFPEVEMSYFQSNIEGELIDKLHEVGFDYDGIILNASAYRNTSVGIGEAVKGIETPVVEVHISNVHEREEYRHVSYIAANAKRVMYDIGIICYELTIHSLLCF